MKFHPTALNMTTNKGRLIVIRMISAIIIFVFLLSACGDFTLLLPATATSTILETDTPVPSVTPAPSPTSATPEAPALVKTSLEFYRDGKTYEIIVGYTEGNASFRATPHPEFPYEKRDKVAGHAEFEWYGDFDHDGEMEFIVSLLYCSAYCSDSIQVYEYDAHHDLYYVADEFGAKSPAVETYTDLDKDGNKLIAEANKWQGCFYPFPGAYSGLRRLNT